VNLSGCRTVAFYKFQKCNQLFSQSLNKEEKLCLHFVQSQRQFHTLEVFAGDEALNCLIFKAFYLNTISLAAQLQRKFFKFLTGACAASNEQ